jgi:transposase
MSKVQRDTRLLIRLGVLALAREVGSVSFACVAAGISRTTFYKIKKAHERSGYQALQPAPRPKPRMPNAFSEAVVEQVLGETRKFPSYSYTRIADRLRRQGLRISGSGVRKIWERREISRRDDRRRWSAASSMSTFLG